MSNTLEEWRPIAGLKGLYEVSSFGRVRSLPREVKIIRNSKAIICCYKGKILKPSITKNGYLVVNIGHTGKQKVQSVHCLVAYAFLPSCPGDHKRNGWHVDHINENKCDNRVENLRWLTHKDNNSTPEKRARIRARPRNAARNRFIKAESS